MSSQQPESGALTSPALELDGPGDAELIVAVRGGDLEAYGTLFERHVDAARRLGRQLVSAGDVDDLVSEAFQKVLGVLQRGGGPDLAFRAYLLTSMRRLHVDKLRAGARLQTTDDLTPYDPGVPFDDTAVSGFENATAAKAFASLPERWQQVLWHTEVEGQKPAEIAPLLGMSANSVSALAYRAREGLRQAFVTMHANEATEDACARTRAELGSFIRGGTSRRDSARIEEHLAGCRECTAIYLELTEVNSHLGAVLAPALLGTFGAGYLAAAHALGAKAAVLAFFGRGKDWAANNSTTVAVGGAVAAAAAVAAAVALSTGSPAPVVSSGPPPVTTPHASAPAPAAPTPPTPPTPSAPAPPTIVASPTTPVAPTASVASTQAPGPASTPTTAPVPAAGPSIVTAPVAATAPASGSIVLDLLAGASSPAGGLHVTSATAVHGTVTPTSGSGPGFFAKASSGQVRYTPDAGWKGADTVTYVITDAAGRSVTGHVTVTTLDAAPTARPVTATVPTAWPVPSSVTIPVLGSVTDANHDAITLVGASAPHQGTTRISNGEIVYTQTTAYGGNAAPAPDTFTYTVTDGTLQATGTVTVTPAVVAAPQAVADTLAAPYETATTFDPTVNDTDPTDASVMSVSGPPAHGTLAVSGRNVTYTPDAGHSGNDAFSYTLTDQFGQASTATVSVTVAQPIEHPSLRPEASLEGHGPNTYQHYKLFLNDIPAGFHANLHIEIAGFTGWGAGPGRPNGCASTLSDSTETIDCPIVTDGTTDQLLIHLDYVGTGLSGTLTGLDYNGSTPVPGP